MAIWGAFTNSSSAMMANSHSMSNISQNIANVSTNGYKRSETLFETMLSESTPAYDFFGVRGVDRMDIDKQGAISGTGNWSDMAISGDGFFVVNTKPDGSGDSYFTRDGSFQRQATPGGGPTYLTTKDGYYVMGWPASAGKTASGSSLSGLKSLQATTDDTTMAASPTTSATILGNIPTGATKPAEMSVEIYDADGNSQMMKFIYTPVATNSWTMSVQIGDQPASTGVPLTFDEKGALVSPTSAPSFNAQYAAGKSMPVTVDISKLNQSYGGVAPSKIEADGYPAGQLASMSFTKNGELYGQYSNDQQKLLFKLPVVTFVEPNALEARSGNLFVATEAAGKMTVSPVTAEKTRSTFVPAAVEAANVDIADEFTRMIVTQKAYTTNSQVFKVADEMVQKAGDLKR